MLDLHKYDAEFWNSIDALVAQSTVVIDRPKGSEHPRYPGFFYPIDYGYLDGTASMDGGGIDVWVGSDPQRKADAVMCIVDLNKKDSEIKILLGCSDEEKRLIYEVHNENRMKGILIKRTEQNL